MRENKVSKKVPQRMCIICRQMFAKTDLLRLVLKESGLIADAGGKLPGRGLYICKDVNCETKFFDSRQLSKLLKRKFTEEETEALKTDVSGARKAQTELLKKRMRKKAGEEKLPQRIVRVKAKDD